MQRSDLEAALDRRARPKLFSLDVTASPYLLAFL